MLLLIKLSTIIHSSMEAPEEYIKKFDKYETLINKQVHNSSQYNYAHTHTHLLLV